MRALATIAGAILATSACLLTVDETLVERDAASDSAIDRDLIARWPFDEGQGAEARDTSGRGHHATLLPGNDRTLPLWTSDAVSGRALRFGAMGGRVEASSLNGSSFPPSGTLSFWFRPDFTAGNFQPFFDQSDVGRRHFFVREWESRTDRIQVGFWEPGTGYVLDADNIAVRAKTWNHIVVTWDADGRRGAIYLGGNVVYSASFGISWTPSDQRMAIGARFDGIIDDVRLYSRPNWFRRPKPYAHAPS